MIVVHHLNNSRSQRVLWLLEELGLDYDIKRYQRDPKTLLAPPALRQVHPLGKSPVLADGDVTLAESGAIIEYLVERHGSGRLRPPLGTPERVRYTYWLHFAEGSAMPPLLMKLVFDRIEKGPMPFFVRPIARGIAGRVKKGFIEPNIARQLDYMEVELEQRPWFAGADFSAADIQMSFPVEAAAARGGLDARRPRLMDWLPPPPPPWRGALPACARARRRILDPHLIALAIHGGAGTMARRKMTPAFAARYEKALARALDAGQAVLAKNGTALDAVCAAVVELEDDALFNAGRGACYNTDEKHELDAAVMDGATRRAGAVGAVSRIRNPVLAARAVMEKSRHVLLVGRGAERYAREHGVRMVPASYFATRSRLLALRRRLVGHHGTVGAVALDGDGRLAAATSTGGYTGKLPGRVGDSPLIGAGTYADDACAVSCTGLGEAFIRTVAAHDIAARLSYRRDNLARASAAALSAIAALGGDGGLIAVDRRGNIVMPFNSEGMYRGAIDRRGRRTIAIY